MSQIQTFTCNIPKCCETCIYCKTKFCVADLKDVIQNQSKTFQEYETIDDLDKNKYVKRFSFCKFHNMKIFDSPYIIFCNNYERKLVIKNWPFLKGRNDL